jgi:hypothetical protein
MDTLGNRIVEKGLRVYDRFSDRAKMPTNRRVFLETVLDKSQAPITEQTLRADELDALRQIIRRKYAPIQPQLTQYEGHLQQRLAQHEQAMLANNKDRVLHPEAFNRYAADLRAIRDFREGFLTPEFIDLAQGKTDYYRQMGMREAGVAQKFGVKPAVTYEDYPIDAKKARVASAGANPHASLSTLLGQFTFAAPDGRLEVTDTYDFNPPRPSFTGAEGKSTGVSVDGALMAAPAVPEGGGSTLYNVLRQFAGTAVPPGRGRPVRIQLNQLAPAPLNAMAR